MLNGIHGHQDIERVVYGKPAGPALLAEAERLGARRVFVTTSKSVASANQNRKRSITSRRPKNSSTRVGNAVRIVTSGSR